MRPGKARVKAYIIKSGLVYSGVLKFHCPALYFAKAMLGAGLNLDAWLFE